jgi:hypothetical protein
MAKVQLHSSVSALTFASSGAQTPSNGNNGKNEVTVSDVESAQMRMWHTRPSLVKTAANGDMTIQLPKGLLTSITIASQAYTPDGNSQIVVPAAAGTAFLESVKYSS